MPEIHFQEYQEYYRKQPFGQWRDDFRAATIASAVTMGQLKKPMTPDKFMHMWKSPEDISMDSDSVEDIVLGSRRV